MEWIDVSKLFRTGNILSDTYVVRNGIGSPREFNIKQLYNKFKNNRTKIYCDEQILKDLERYEFYLSAKKETHQNEKNSPLKNRKIANLDIGSLVVYDIN